jgi:glycosyltransferase involved in cell wall biosynthesis
LKIVFINPVREFGGGERWMLSMGAALQQQGHAVSVLCRPGTVWLEAAAADRVRTLVVPMRNDLSVASIRRMAGQLRAEAPNVVVCCNQRAVRLGVVAARFAGRPPVVFRNGLARSFKDSAFNRFIARGVARFVVNAHALAEELLRYRWVPRDRVSVIYNGVDLPFYSWPRVDEARRRWGLPHDSLLVVAAGRLVAEKGHTDLVEAAALLRASHPRLQVVIAGEGPQAEPLREQIASLGLNDTVRLVGFEPDIPAALHGADIYCHPSRREGLPNAVLEAMAAGLPVVATAIDGTPEVVSPDETGFLVGPADPRALAERLDLLLSRGDLRYNFGRRARHRVEDAFSLSICRRRWETLLGEVIAARRAPQPAVAVQGAGA